MTCALAHEAVVYGLVYDLLSLQRGDAHTQKDGSLNRGGGVPVTEFKKGINDLVGQLPESLVKFFVGKTCYVLSSFLKIVCSFHYEFSCHKQGQIFTSALEHKQYG